MPYTVEKDMLMLDEIADLEERLMSTHTRITLLVDEVFALHQRIEEREKHIQKLEAKLQTSRYADGV